MTDARPLLAVLAAAAMGIVVPLRIRPEGGVPEPPSAVAEGPRGASRAGQSPGSQEAWQRVGSPVQGPVTVIDAVSADEVWLAAVKFLTGTAVYRRQGGAWEEMIYYDSRGINDAHMLSAADGWFVGYDWDVSTFTMGALAVRYHDGAFDAQVIESNAAAAAIDMISPTEGWAVGGHQTGPDGTFAEGVVWHLEDGRWRTAATVPGQSLVDIDMVDRDEGWAAGVGGALLHYASGGWSPVTLPEAIGLRAIDMVDADNGWATGDAGRWLRYTDGVWHLVDTPLTGRVRRIRMISPAAGWAAGVDGARRDALVLRYRDGTWQRDTDLPEGLGALYALDVAGPAAVWAGGQEAGDAVDVAGVVLYHGSPLPTPTATATPEGISEYEGLYEASFEVSSFVTGTLRCPGYGAGWWLVGNDEFYERLRELYPDPGREPRRVYTRFRGLLSPPGQYGHLGGYGHEVRVIEVAQMEPIESCPIPNYTPPPPGTEPPPGTDPTPGPTATPTGRLWLPRAFKNGAEFLPEGQRPGTIQRSGAASVTGR
ncbi:MAG: WD40/YVTN/BNR-like repeat-containing protein [Anaerolineae bacterium]